MDMNLDPIDDLSGMSNMPDFSGLPGFDLDLIQNKSYKAMAAKMTEFEIIEEMNKLRKQNKRQKLILEAIWYIVKSQGATDDQLLKALAEVDVSEVDRIKRQRENTTDPCPNCQVPMMRTEGIVHRCIYCGHERIGNPFDF
ncbi:MAG: hypothetical protein GXY06_06450 [Clostridiaceae bacterium]|nr:hypothetical protein [Clostridiaceae bacterium]